MSKVNVAFGYSTDVGRVREENQDWYGIDGPLKVAATGEDAYLFVVADGMGGHVGGAAASKRAVKVMLDRFRNVPLESDIKEWVVNTVQAAHLAVAEDGRADPPSERRGTTVSALLIVGDRAAVSHVGDSRVYQIREGALTQITKDQAYEGRLFQAVGYSKAIEVETHEVQVQAGDAFVLTTDGVTNEVDDDRIFGVVGRVAPEAAAHELTALANRHGGRDNATAVVVSVGGVAAPQKATRILKWAGIAGGGLVTLALIGFIANWVGLFGDGREEEPSPDIPAAVVGESAETAATAPTKSAPGTSRGTAGGRTEKEAASEIKARFREQAIDDFKRARDLIARANNVESALRNGGFTDKADKARSYSKRLEADSLELIRIIKTNMYGRKEVETLGEIKKRVDGIDSDLATFENLAKKEKPATPETGAKGVPAAAEEAEKEEKAEEVLTTVEVPPKEEPGPEEAAPPEGPAAETPDENK